MNMHLIFSSAIALSFALHLFAATWELTDPRKPRQATITKWVDWFSVSCIVIAAAWLTLTLLKYIA